MEKMFASWIIERYGIVGILLIVVIIGGGLFIKWRERTFAKSSKEEKEINDKIRKEYYDKIQSLNEERKEESKVYRELLQRLADTIKTLEHKNELYEATFKMGRMEQTDQLKAYIDSKTEKLKQELIEAISDLDDQVADNLKRLEELLKQKTK
ncbi:MAG: hypothetical protein HC836_47175 [Richelia sp. RM2_1_2]|nr:hypothetical protein [Richelia sp. RM2_1_2]